MNREIFRLALPSIFSNLTVPLLGLVDVAITGHLGDASYIGAIALGGMIFNLLYWSFGFLRMGTSGMTAQAFGSGDKYRQMQILVQAVIVGLAIASVILLFKRGILELSLFLIDAPQDIERYTAIYFNIVIWGAPALLSIYGFKGWFVGMQNTKYTMYIAIFINVVNIMASLLFVYGLDMKIEGVALGTLVAQYSGVLLSVILWKFGYKGYRLAMAADRSLFAGNGFGKFFRVNSAIFFRTLCLISVTTFFTWAGGKQGETILAVNTLLMQFFTVFSYILDGFAYAGEALAGRFMGEGNPLLLRRTVRMLFLWGTVVMSFFTLVYMLWGNTFLSVLTDDREVLRRAGEYFYWVLSVPICGYAAFMWDGILIGITAAKHMFAAMLVAALVFFSVFFLPPFLCDAGDPVSIWTGTFDNHRLWFAFLCYLLTRSIVQTIWPGRRLIR